MMNAQFLIQSLITLVGTGGILGGYQLWRDRKKSAAEAENIDSQSDENKAKATDIIQGTAARELQRMEDLLTKEREVSVIRRHAGSKLYNHTKAHERWDQQMIAQLAQLGVIMEPPPTLELSDEEKKALELF